MKANRALLLLLLVSGCYPEGFTHVGSTRSPEGVLLTARKSAEQLDYSTWGTDVLSGRALCEYGNREGQRRIHDSLKLLGGLSSTQLSGPFKVSDKALPAPGWKGFWIYRQELYSIRILTSRAEPGLRITVICEQGHKENRPELIGAPTSSFSLRHCSIARIVDSLSGPSPNAELCKDVR